MTVLHGDCLAVMPTLDAVDAIVCDPPYGLSFMGKDWDHGIPGTTFWEAALGCAKPGAYLLAFGGTRTFHRLACAIEDAGWEIRDCLSWLYGSGFPKSLDVSKAMDRAAGVKGTYGGPKSEAHAGWIERGKMRGDHRHEGHQRPWMDDPAAVDRNAREYIPGSALAKQWDGWGTALKPGYEPIILARKPLTGTVAQNVAQHGTGALNIDGCRISTGNEHIRGTGDRRTSPVGIADTSTRASLCNGGNVTHSGRWPANVVLSHTEDCREVGTRRVKGSSGGATGNYPGSVYGPRTDIGGKVSRPCDADGMETVTAWECAPDCPVAMLDAQSGERVHGAGRARTADEGTHSGGQGTIGFNMGAPAMRYGDNGGPSRFFYTAKASRREREAGLEGMPVKRGGAEQFDSRWKDGIGEDRMPTRSNGHPTVKPLSLMRWLCRLVTPPNGLILDPFCGSGSTGCAAVLEGFQFIGIEQAEKRIAHWAATVQPELVA
jgi:hypothetical protein